MKTTQLALRQPDSLALPALAEKIDHAFLKMGFSKGEAFTSRAAIGSIYDTMTSAADARIFGGYDRIDDAKTRIQSPMYVFEDTTFSDHGLVLGFSLNSNGPPFVLQGFTYHEEVLSPGEKGVLDTYFDGTTHKMKKRYSGFENQPQHYDTYQEAIEAARKEKERLTSYWEELSRKEEKEISNTTEGVRLSVLIASGQAVDNLPYYLDSLQNSPLDIIISLAMVMEKRAKRKDEPYLTIAQKLWELIDEKSKPETSENLLKTISAAARLANDEFRATTPAEEPTLSSLNLNAQIYLYSSLIKAYGTILGLNNLKHENGQWQVELLSYESNDWNAKTPELEVQKSSTETAPSFEELLKKILGRLHSKHEEADSELRHSMGANNFY